MRRGAIAVLAAFLLCAATVPDAFAAAGAAGAEYPRSIGGAPLGEQKAPAEETSAGGVVCYAQGVPGPGQAELRVTVPETPPKAGETFTVAVDIVGNPGFAAVQFTLPYDKDAMECTSANPGELMRGMLAASNKNAPAGAIVAGASMETIQGDGRLAVFTFTARKDLTSGGFRLADVLIAGTDGENIIRAVAQEETETPAPPEAPRDLEKETEAVMAELEKKIDQERPQETVPETPPAQNPGETVKSRFTDMDGHWAAADVERAADLGIIGGYADGTFKPDNTLTRAQFVTILYRQAGRPAVTEAAPFTDIAGINEEFQTAIAWAYGKKLVEGTTATTFNPNGPLSRQATMKILFQHNGGTAGEEQMFYSVYDGAFPDSSSMVQWARMPMYWAVYNTLLDTENGAPLNPAQPMTRAGLARSMVRYIDRFGGDETR